MDTGIYTGKISKAHTPLHFETVRELSEADIIVRQACNIGSVTPSIKSLRATHHKLAQCLASGFSDSEASLSTGYSPSRISILKRDPAFRELLAFYSEARKEVFIDVTQRMAGFATTAVEVLQERLEDSPQAFSNKDLNDLIKTTADRGGHSPVQKTENKTIILDARQLSDIKKEVESKQNGQVRKINQSEESQRVKTFLEEGSGTGLGSNDNRPSSDVLQETETARSPSQGDDL